MSVIQNLGKISIALMILAAAFIIIITLIEKKLLTKIIGGRNKRDRFYQAQFKAIDKSSLENTVKGLDAVAKNFFAEAFKINNSDYAELKKAFKKTKNKDAEKFSELMLEIFYSPEKNQEEINQSLSLLNKIISKTHIVLKEEKESSKKVDQENIFKRILRKAHILGVGEKENQKKDQQGKKQ